MSHTQLESLLPVLDALDAARVRRPDVPLDLFLQEADDLAEQVAQPNVTDRLIQIGLPQADLTLLPAAVGALRVAQSRWVDARDRGKTETQVDREHDAYELRAVLLDACRWSLRDDPVAMNTLRAISDAEGLTQLVSDLHDIAHLVSSRRAMFAGDTTFDAPAQAERARSTAALVEASVGTPHLDEGQRKAAALRDRAFTLLDRIIADLHAAGHYAFRHQPAIRRCFISETRACRRHTRRGGETTAEGPGV